MLSDNVTAKGLFNIAKQSRDYTDEKLVLLLKQAEDLAIENEEFPIACDVLTLSGRINRIKGDLYKSLSQLNSAFKIHTKSCGDDKYRLGMIYRELSALYGDSFNDWHTAIEYSRKCIQLNVKELNPIFYNNIASNYISAGQYDDALPFLEKGKILTESANDYYSLSYIYENYGEVCRLKGDISKSIHYLNEGLKSVTLAYENHSKYQEVIIINCYLILGLGKAYIDQKNYKEARLYIDKLRSLSIENHLFFGIDESYLLEGEIELALENYDNFLKLYDTAITTSSSQENYSNLDSWYRKVMFVYEQKQNYKMALEMSKKIIGNRDKHVIKESEIGISSFVENKESEILELINSNQAMQLQKEELEQFAYIVTHDLKTPLSNIANFAGLLLKKNGSQVDDKGKEYIQTIVSNSQELTYMLTDLMNYVTLGDSDQQISECSLQEVVDSVIRQNLVQIQNAKADVTLHASINLKMRKVHLKQLLTNLILNAIKFAKEDTPPKIEIYSEEDVLSNKIIVSDNGIGIDEDYRKQIFQIFKRLNKSDFSGSGMGLAICKKIVESYGGRIWVEESESGGSEFHFTIFKRGSQDVTVN